MLINIHSHKIIYFKQKIYRKRVFYLNSNVFFYEEYHNHLIDLFHKHISELIISANNLIVNETFSAKYIGVGTHIFAMFLL